MASVTDKQGNIPFFGQLSWGNLLDWLVTLCLGGIFMLTVVSLGAVRPDMQLDLLPLYSILLFLHGLWLALDDDSPKRLSHVPLWFVPGVLWVLCSVLWISPVAWRGWYELVSILGVFIVLWVLCNNVRSRAQLWLLIIMSLAPALVAVFNGFYQFFQDPGRMVGGVTGYRLEIHPEFLGRATGAFADPNTFAAFLLILLPSLLIAAAVPRFPLVLRLLFLYIALMFLGAIAFTQSYWATVMVVVLLAIVPWFCFRTLKRRSLFSLLGVTAASVVFAGMVVYHPLFKKSLQRAASEEGEGVRLVLWGEALAMVAEHPITGVGAGAYGASFEQSPRVALADVPTTPHNDYLLVFSQLGLLGVILFGVPSLYILYLAWARWRKEPYAVKLRDAKGTIMPPQRFFLSLGLAGALAFGLCLTMTFVFYVPALVIYGVLALSILIKSSFSRRITLPVSGVLRLGYFLLAACAGGSFYVLSSSKLEAQALELRGRQELEHVVDLRVHVSGNTELLDRVIRLYEDAVILDPANVDAWLGLSASICQLYFRNPADFEEIGARAIRAAGRAVELSPRYFKTWLQMGVARSFHGDGEQAEVAFIRALELAPSNSNAHYYYAAFLGTYKDRREDALNSVKQALEINPRNAAARRLQQKLLIL